MAARCATKRGEYQCDKALGHEGDCEHTPPSHYPLDFDAHRELRRAAARIEVLRKALDEIKTAPCDAAGGASCLCCLHDRLVASSALRVLE